MAVLDGPSDFPSSTDSPVAVASDLPMRRPRLRQAIHSWSHPSHHEVGEKDNDADHEPIDRNSVAESSHSSSAHKAATANVWSHLYFNSHSKTHETSRQPRDKERDAGLESKNKNAVDKPAHAWSSRLLYFHSHSKSHDKNKHVETPSSRSHPREAPLALESIVKNPPLEPAVRNPSLDSTIRDSPVESTVRSSFDSTIRDPSFESTPRSPSLKSTVSSISLKSTLKEGSLKSTASNTSLESTLKEDSLEPSVPSPSFESISKRPSLESIKEEAVPELVKKGPEHGSTTKERVLKSPSTHSLPQFLYFQSDSRSQKRPPKEKDPEVQSVSSQSSNWPHILYFQSHSRLSLGDRSSLHDGASKVKHSINRLSLEIFRPPKEEARLYYGKRVVDMFEWAETEDVELKVIYLRDLTPCSILIGTDKTNNVEYILHKTLLCEQSPFLRNAFEEQRRKRGYSTAQYEQYPTMALKEEETEEPEKEDALHLAGTSRPIFDLLVRWLYHIGSTWTVNNAHLLLQLYVLADKLGIEALKDDCVDFIIPLVSSEYRFHGLDIAYVYLNTKEDSPLRKLMVRIVGYHIRYEKLLLRSGEWETSIMRQVSKNGEFAKDLVRALAETDEKLVCPGDEWGVSGMGMDNDDLWDIGFGT